MFSHIYGYVNILFCIFLHSDILQVLHLRKKNDIIDSITIDDNNNPNNGNGNDDNYKINSNMNNDNGNSNGNSNGDYDF